MKKRLAISIKDLTGHGGLLRKMLKLDIFLIDYEIFRANPNWWLEITDIFLKPGLRFRASFERDKTNILENFFDYGCKLEISYEKYLTNVIAL